MMINCICPSDLVVQIYVYICITDDDDEKLDLQMNSEMKESEKSLDSQLWHACAGGMVQMPPVNSKVFYFPQGHSEHAISTVDLPSRLPPLILSLVSSVQFLADPDTDEVYSRIRLTPLHADVAPENDDDVAPLPAPSGGEKPSSFAKTLTQSDANNGGGFSVPRYCAETIFPRLDYAADPPVQTIVVRDVHGEEWKFRHIYRGTPRRHLLTTGWSNFVNQKKLVAGDSIVFLRADNGHLCVGIRRAKRGGVDRWSSASGNNNGGGMLFSGFVESGCRGRGKVTAESVAEAVSRAVSGRQFEVVYYPRASTPEFVIRASAVRAAMRVHWYPGMRFKMPFETEDSSRISWFMGSVASVHVADPVRWPNSPWRLLQVTWDEPDLLQNVKRVSPWLVELVSTMPTINMSSFSPPRKKLRGPQHPDFFDGQFFIPSFSDNPLGPSSPMYCLPDNISAGIQGARHAQFGIPLSDFHLSNKQLQLGLFPNCFPRISPGVKIASDFFANHPPNEGILCPKSEKKNDNNENTPQFVLFGQPILTEQQINRNSLRDAVSNALKRKSSPSGDSTDKEEEGSGISDVGLDTGHCKVFMESEDVGRTLDLSVLESYEDLYKRLANMFGFDRSDMPRNVLYQDASGAVKQTGYEPFSDFTKAARRLTISSGSNTSTRKWMTGLQNAEIGLDSSTKTGGALTIFV